MTHRQRWRLRSRALRNRRVAGDAVARSAAPGIAVALGVLALGLIAAFAVGRYPVGLSDFGRLMWAQVTGTPSGVAPAIQTVIFEIRGPRVLAAVLVGAALAVAGTAFQGLFRNPL
ncbi:MAG TPA: iron chelate uptake ABC transporter family permease subunit, partial [Xanthobacteraceae bacterium]|nr:iron chelate uptake ABC transporter family permease subunit [Xanthobacteraceae bacterium]